MKPKLLLCLALVLSGGLLCCRTGAQNISETNKWHGFETLPPIANANPSIRLPLVVHVPTRLKIERTNDMLSVKVDNLNSLQTISLMVGTNMVTGVESEWYVYPAGESRPANGGLGLGGTDFNLGTHFWHTKPDGVPVAGKKYVVEVAMTTFQTDIPPQHHWSPHGKNHKVLWQQTLTQIVE